MLLRPRIVVETSRCSVSGSSRRQFHYLLRNYGARGGVALEHRRKIAEALGSDRCALNSQCDFRVPGTENVKTSYQSRDIANRTARILYADERAYFDVAAAGRLYKAKKNSGKRTSTGGVSGRFPAPKMSPPKMSPPLKKHAPPRPSPLKVVSDLVMESPFGRFLSAIQNMPSKAKALRLALFADEDAGGVAADKETPSKETNENGKKKATRQNDKKFKCNGKCGMEKEKNAYSKSQFDSGATRRRCKDCVAANEAEYYKSQVHKSTTRQAYNPSKEDKEATSWGALRELLRSTDLPSTSRTAHLNYLRYKYPQSLHLPEDLASMCVPVNEVNTTLKLEQLRLSHVEDLLHGGGVFGLEQACRDWLHKLKDVSGNTRRVWTNLKYDAETFILRCEECIRRGRAAGKGKAEEGTIPRGIYSGRVIGIDLKTIKSNATVGAASGKPKAWTVLTLVCHLSLRVWAYHLPDATATTVQNCILKWVTEVLCDIPQAYLSDNGGQFRTVLASVPWKTLWGAAVFFIPPTNPISNGICERRNGIIGQLSGKGPESLPSVVLATNLRRAKGKTMSPAERFAQCQRVRSGLTHYNAQKAIQEGGAFSSDDLQNYAGLVEKFNNEDEVFNSGDAFRRFEEARLAHVTALADKDSAKLLRDKASGEPSSLVFFLEGDLVPPNSIDFHRLRFYWFAIVLLFHKYQPQQFTPRPLPGSLQPSCLKVKNSN